MCVQDMNSTSIKDPSLSHAQDLQGVSAASPVRSLYLSPLLSLPQGQPEWNLPLTWCSPEWFRAATWSQEAVVPVAVSLGPGLYPSALGSSRWAFTHAHSGNDTGIIDSIDIICTVSATKFCRQSRCPPTSAHRCAGPGDGNDVCAPAHMVNARWSNQLAVDVLMWVRPADVAIYVLSAVLGQCCHGKCCTRGTTSVCSS
jgi:hypothetical protein